MNEKIVDMMVTVFIQIKLSKGKGIVLCSFPTVISVTFFPYMCKVMKSYLFADS